MNWIKSRNTLRCLLWGTEDDNRKLRVSLCATNSTVAKISTKPIYLKPACFLHVKYFGNIILLSVCVKPATTHKFVFTKIDSHPVQFVKLVSINFPYLELMSHATKQMLAGNILCVNCSLPQQWLWAPRSHLTYDTFTMLSMFPLWGPIKHQSRWSIYGA
jgi:hypothetical protein